MVWKRQQKPNEQDRRKLLERISTKHILILLFDHRQGSLNLLSKTNSHKKGKGRRKRRNVWSKKDNIQSTVTLQTTPTDLIDQI